jgi:S-adenosylmethionine hydrolase
MSVDRFGNLITNIAAADPRNQGVEIRAGSYTVRELSRTYGDAEPGRVLALLGSSERLELAVNRGSAADQLGLQVGDPVVLEYR